MKIIQFSSPSQIKAILNRSEQCLRDKYNLSDSKSFVFYVFKFKNKRICIKHRVSKKKTAKSKEKIMNRIVELVSETKRRNLFFGSSNILTQFLILTFF